MSKKDLFKILKSKIGKDSESEVFFFLEYRVLCKGCLSLDQYYFSSNISMVNNISIISLSCANGVPRPSLVPEGGSL